MCTQTDRRTRSQCCWNDLRWSLCLEIHEISYQSWNRNAKTKRYRCRHTRSRTITLYLTQQKPMTGASITTRGKWPTVFQRRRISVLRKWISCWEKGLLCTPNENENEYVYNYLDYPLLTRYNYNTTTITGSGTGTSTKRTRIDVLRTPLPIVALDFVLLHRYFLALALVNWGTAVQMFPYSTCVFSWSFFLVIFCSSFGFRRSKAITLTWDHFNLHLA